MLDLLIRAVLATAAAGAVSGLGAVPLLFVSDVPPRTYSGLLGFSGGVMLGMATLVLLPRSIADGSPPAVLGGLAAGATFVMLMELALPHLEPHFGAQTYDPGLRDALLLVAAIAIHNIPEGLAMGLGYATGQEGVGPKLVAAVAFQNIPEGLAVALPLRRNGVSPVAAVVFAAVSGLTEVIGAVVGVVCARFIEALLPFGLALAAGALIYVMADQLIPEAHDTDRGMLPAWGATAGIALVLALGWIFGISE